MRKTRRLTEGERWELGLFMAMLLVGCLLITALVRNNAFANVFAFAWTSHSTSAQTPQTSTPATAAQQLSTPTIPSPYLPISLTQLMPPESITPAPAIEQKDTPKDAPTVALNRVASRKTAPQKATDIRYYDGQKYKFLRTLHLRVTAYAPDKRCTWPYPGTTTASGLSVKTNHGKLVAADTQLIPMYALVDVPGYSKSGPVPVLDRGGAIKGHRLDVLMPTFDSAKDWGSRLLDVKIYVPVDN